MTDFGFSRPLDYIDHLDPTIKVSALSFTLLNRWSLLKKWGNINRRQKHQFFVYNCIKRIIWGSRLIKNTLLRFDLKFLDLNTPFKDHIFRALTLQSTQTFLAKTKKIINLCDARDLRIMTNIKTPVIGIYNSLQKHFDHLAKKKLCIGPVVL